MKAIFLILFLTLTMTASTKAYYDDDRSIPEVCEDELNRNFGADLSGTFWDVAGEEVLKQDYFGNEYWYLVNNDAVYYVNVKEDDSLGKVQVVFAD